MKDSPWQWDYRVEVDAAECRRQQKGLLGPEIGSGAFGGFVVARGGIGPRRHWKLHGMLSHVHRNREDCMDRLADVVVVDAVADAAVVGQHLKAAGSADRGSWMSVDAWHSSSGLRGHR